MMVTFISQCEKKALKKTRRVLDAFADRIGANTWQTVITLEGLEAVKKLLRKTASKNTAVSCHWIRSRSRSELVWVVGRRSAFNQEGRVPVNSTKKIMPVSYEESDYHYLPLIQALTGMAALMHDWGKASALFQEKLKSSNRYESDPVRHEWISCLLLQALVQQHSDWQKQDDAGWLNALINQKWSAESVSALSSEMIEASNRPLQNLPPVAKLVAWLIVTHHRLPLPKNAKDYRGEKAEGLDAVLGHISHLWGYTAKGGESSPRLKDCFCFPDGIVENSGAWQKMLNKWANKLQACLPMVKQALSDGSYRVVLHHARLSLMLADHYYSSLDATVNYPDKKGLFANTDLKNAGALKQKLDEHLIGVARQGIGNVWRLPFFENNLPVVQDKPALKKKSPPDFAWQDTAVNKIKQWRSKEKETCHGFFAVNMASTGKGKTFANAKIMQALSSDGKSLRYTLTLGLRTLTLQTGDEYRERIGLDDTELAVLIGSRAVLELHRQKNGEPDISSAESEGSESAESLFNEDIDYDDYVLPDEGLTTVLKRKKDLQFLYAPVLACTIDHMMAAIETRRGGRYILPSLRLASSDLVIDEVDDFTEDDLTAIGRLIHLAGMLGRKVMISSATTLPDQAEGYFQAYRAGWRLFCKTRNADSGIGCAWVDEFTSQVTTHNESNLSEALENYRNDHSRFVNKRAENLCRMPAMRRGEIIPCDSVINFVSSTKESNKQQAYFKLAADAALKKHQHHHTVDKVTELKVSFGLIRVANISPCVALTRYLLEHDWPEDTRVRVMAYHSQQVLLLRHLQEAHLDEVLQRKEGENEPPQAFENEHIRRHLDSTGKFIRHVLFILVATPVAEVGRDHDFDWAVVEPSSHRSIIQLAGRVQRHRCRPVEQPNIALLEYNWLGIKYYNNRDKNSYPFHRAFIRPGFETFFRLKSHSLNDLVDCSAIAKKLDATPRIQKPATAKEFKPDRVLAHLEHAETRRLLITNDTGPESLRGYLSGGWFLTALSQKLAPFRAGRPNRNVYYVYDSDDETCSFYERDNRGELVERQRILGIKCVSLSEKAMNNLWLVRDYEQALEQLAQERASSLRSTSIYFGELNFPEEDNCQYKYSDQLGLVKKNQQSEGE